jgi:hypothetical protein
VVEFRISCSLIVVFKVAILDHHAHQEELMHDRQEALKKKIYEEKLRQKKEDEQFLQDVEAERLLDLEERTFKEKVFTILSLLIMNDMGLKFKF